MSKTGLDAATADRPKRENQERDRARAAATGRPEDEPTVRLNAQVPESRRERFKERCAEEGRTLKYVLNQLVEHYASGGELP